MALDAFKIADWVRENADTIAELIPVKLCADHEDGGETCWGQDGHLWKGGHHQILAICHPREAEVFGCESNGMS